MGTLDKLITTYFSNIFIGSFWRSDFCKKSDSAKSVHKLIGRFVKSSNSFFMTNYFFPKRKGTKVTMGDSKIFFDSLKEKYSINWPRRFAFVKRPTK